MGEEGMNKLLAPARYGNITGVHHARAATTTTTALVGRPTIDAC